MPPHAPKPLGNPHLLARAPVFAARANAVQVENARRRAAAVLPYIEQARRAGAAHRWAPAQVRRIVGTAVVGT